MIRSKIVGVGSYLPEKIMSNEDVSKLVDTNDDWITSRVGIKKRHIAGENEFTSDLATKSLEKALINAGLDANDLDVIVVATSTPDVILPSTATIVQSKIKMNKGWAVDINAVCSGFLYAMELADGLICSKKAKRIAVIGAETYSRIVDWKDRNTCVLFGDGAGCFVLEANESDDSGIIDIQLHSDGDMRDILHIDGGVSVGNREATILMNGKEVYKKAVEKMYNSIKTILDKNSLTISDIDWVLPHQANYRIISSIANKLNVPEEQCMISLDQHANTAAATIPLAFDDYLQKGKVKRGDMVSIAVAGAGFAWGAGIFKF